MKKAWISIGFASLLMACEKELVSLRDLDLSHEALPYQIAVDGFISSERTFCKIKLSVPVSTADDLKPVPLVNAVVTLNDGEVIYAFAVAEEEEEGVYTSIDSIQGIVGKVYTLEIQSNGKSYTASDVMPAASNESIVLPFSQTVIYDENGNEKPQDDGFIQLNISEHNFGYEKPMLISFDEKFYGETIHLPPTNIYDLSSTRNYLHKGSIPQGLFPSGFLTSGVSGEPTDSLELIKMSISESYYQYLLSVFSETDWKTSIFSTVPGNVKTNVSEGGTGFFYALNVKRKRLTYYELAKEADSQ